MSWRIVRCVKRHYPITILPRSQKERNCTPSMVVLSWVLNAGAAVAVKSVSHMEENLNSNFILSMKEFDSIEDKNIRVIQER